MSKWLEALKSKRFQAILASAIAAIVAKYMGIELDQTTIITAIGLLLAFVGGDSIKRFGT